MTPPGDRIGVVVVGYGYWGPNLVRNIAEHPGLELVSLAESNSTRAARFSAKFPGVPTFDGLGPALTDPRADAVVVATPPRTHHALAREAILAGRHVLVEKPLATTVQDAHSLVELANSRNVLLMPGHTFLYSPAVEKIRDLIAAGEVGDIYFVTSSRMNLGLYQPDGVISDLAPHDVSILLYLLDQRVVRVSASGRSTFQAGVPETAFLTLTFEGGATANLQLSWLAPSKVRQMIIVGSKRMLQYDDTSPDEAVRVYDRGLDMDVEATTALKSDRLMSRSGDMVVPRLDAAEPLARELDDFAEGIRTGRRPRSHAALGLEVVRILEAAHASFEAGGHGSLITAGGAVVSRTPPAEPEIGRSRPGRFGRG